MCMRTYFWNASMLTKCEHVSPIRTCFGIRTCGCNALADLQTLHSTHTVTHQPSYTQLHYASTQPHEAVLQATC